MGQCITWIYNAQLGEGKLLSHVQLFATPYTMLLLLLSHFSRVRLCATPWMAAHQAPPSLGFSRQEHWSGLPFPSPMHESEVTRSCVCVCYFLLQCVKVKSLSRVCVCVYAHICPSWLLWAGPQELGEQAVPGQVVGG